MKINEIIYEGFKIDTSPESKMDLRKAVSELNPQQQLVIQMRFTHDMTLDEIASEMKITKERVRQVLLKAFRILKHYSKGIVDPEEAAAISANISKEYHAKTAKRDKKYQIETATAGGSSAGGIASTSNGFANGGPGTLTRAGTIPKKKKTNKKNDKYSKHPGE